MHLAANRGASAATEPPDRPPLPSPAARGAERDGWLADVAWPSTGMPARPQASLPCSTARPTAVSGFLGMEAFGSFAEVVWRMRADVVELATGM